MDFSGSAPRASVSVSVDVNAKSDLLRRLSGLTLGRVDTINLTQRREGAKSAKMRLLRRYSQLYPLIPDFTPSFLILSPHSQLHPVIPDFHPVTPDLSPSSPIYPPHSQFSPRHSRESGNPEGWGRHLCAPLPPKFGILQPRAPVSTRPSLKRTTTAPPFSISPHFAPLRLRVEFRPRTRYVKLC